MTENDVRKAKLEVADRYQKSANFILTLSLGTLVLSTIFLRDIIGIASDRLIGGSLPGIMSSWICLAFSIVFCITYFYASTQFIKYLYRLKLSRFWKSHAEAICYWSFGLSVTFFGFGVIHFILYVYLVNVRFS